MILMINQPISTAFWIKKIIGQKSPKTDTVLYGVSRGFFLVTTSLTVHSVYRFLFSFYLDLNFIKHFFFHQILADEAKKGLQEAKKCLMLTIGDDAKQLGVHLDSFILLGKLHFAELNFEDALKYYDKANIDSLEERQLPPRSLKIMAEAFAIKVNLVMESLFFFITEFLVFQTQKYHMSNLPSEH